MTEKQIKECLDYILTNIQCMEFIILPESEKGLVCETITDALDLINRLQAEIDELNHDIDILSNIKEDLKKDLKNVETANKNYSGNLKKLNKDHRLLQKELEHIKVLYVDEQLKVENAKAEAIKEFAERLKAYLLLHEYHQLSVISLENIEYLVKEMVGEE